MALIQCSECGGTVSTEAMACPKCGAVRKKPESELAAYFRLQVIGALIFLVFVLVWGTWKVLTR